MNEMMEQPEENAGSEMIAGKFKGGEQLEEAYKALEAEFTRRNQQLNQLAEENKVLREQIEGEDENDRTVAEFLNENPVAVSLCDEITELLMQDDSLEGKDGLSKALMAVLSSKYRTPQQMMEDDAFLTEHVFNNEKVKEAVIRSYLDSISEAPTGLLRGKMPVNAHTSPKTVHAAGEMARALFRK